MKKFSSVLLSFMIAAPLTALADGGLTIDPEGPPVGNLGGNPKSPSAPEWISCDYVEGEFVFGIPFDFAYMDVTVTETATGAFASGYIFDDQSGISWPNASGAYYITAVSDTGVSYSGTVNI